MFLFVLILCLFFISNQLSAQESQLEEIVVTATRIEELKKDVPYSVQIIKQEEIKTSTGKNVGDLIIESAIGHISKDPGQLTTFYLRGFGGGLDPTSARNLILINGFRTATINLAQIPVDDIERIEILKGPASVLYGSNAMGGVINIITKEAKEEGIHGSLGVEVGSWERRKASGEIQLKKSQFDAYLFLSRSDASDYKVKDYGVYKNTGYNDETVSFRLGYEFIKDSKISFGFKHYRGWEIGSPGSIVSPTPRDYVDHSLDSFDIIYKTPTFQAGYYLSKRKYESHDNTWGSGIYLYKTDSQGVSLQKFFDFAEHRIIFGGEWNEVKLENRNEKSSPYQPDSRYQSLGAFSELRLSFDKLLIFIGGRYDYFENEIFPTPGMQTIPRAENLDHITVRGGVVYKFNDSLSLRANVGTGFRAPSPTEYAGEYIFEKRRYIGNPSLKPEKSINYEGGFSFSKSGFNTDFTFFHSIFRDKIVSYLDTALNVNTYKYYKYKNEEKATIQGWELNASYNLKEALSINFSLEPFINITYHTRYSDSNGKTLLATPKWLGSFGLKAFREKWQMRIIANYYGDENINYYDPITWSSKIVKKPDFTVVNFKALYNPIKSLELSFAIENLLNRKYEFNIGYPMPERTFAFGMKWLF
ncbi:MAG: TonB-dependent receptor [Thermodesulfovibrio sp.]|jgi:vitamin B12 transporter|uniref:TonB-dependent receptor plug domain-containing protein n=1 Tax=Thermodesulfovibrio sp. N1 TaxID=1871110 RepID=UPI00083AF8E0|nr:TonB-dependent receptor [Thermodesulfovibrio sp. N1]MDI6714475.1 TonB-dependent receptor [Thermodesulfovibrio sp.]ODA43875.1 Outer membrane vitamin B12 receptor BtuB [Thermodesulfovibrio sp. N1]